MLTNRMVSIASAAAATCAVILTSSASGQCEPAWSALGSGVDGGVWALTVFDDGSGPTLYAGGEFTTAGGVTARSVAKWDGAAWSGLGGFGGFPYLLLDALTVFDDGSGAGPALYAAGSETIDRFYGPFHAYIAKWDGAASSALGSGLTGWWVDALTVFDDGSGPAFYAGGAFTTAGGVTAPGIARWDGAAWSALGSGMGEFDRVYALTVFDDGSGPALYAGGYFTAAGGVTVNQIAKWDGAAWSALGSGTDSWVYALTAFDDGSGGGPALYAGGAFTTAGGVTAPGIAKWDGAAWSALGSGMDREVLALTVFDDGSGPALYAGGAFTTAGGAPANNIAKWDGAAWSALSSGMSGDGVSALTVFDDGSGGRPALYAGGLFDTAGGVPAKSIARWGCEDRLCPADCDGSGELDFFDFLCFQNLFAAGDPAADCDESGALDFFDFLCFQNQFAAGCP